MNYIIFDLEATCWLGHPPNGTQEIIEIGAVKVDHYAEVVDTFNMFVRPVVNTQLSAFCRKLTSITQKDVDTADSFDVVIEEFQDWIDIDEDFILCAWGDWDVKMLRHDCLLHKLDTAWLGRSSNLKTSYKNIYGLNNPMGLKNAIKNEGLEFTGIHHRAISDAENTAKLFIIHFDQMGRMIG